MKIDIENSNVLLKLAQYKQNLEERENEVYLLIDYNENELKRLEEELIKADSRHMLEYTEETKVARNTLIKTIADVKDELQQHYRFVANLNRPHAREVLLTAEEKNHVVNVINDVSQLSAEKAELLIEALEEVKGIFRVYKLAYNESYLKCNEVVSLMVPTIGKSETKRIIQKLDQKYIGTVDRAIEDFKSELNGPMLKAVGVLSGL